MQVNKMHTLKAFTPVNSHRDFDDTDDRDIVFLDPAIDSLFHVPVKPIRFQAFERLIDVEFYQGDQYNDGFFDVTSLAVNEDQTGFSFDVDISEHTPTHPDFAKVYHAGCHLLTFRLILLEFGPPRQPPKRKSNFLGMYLTTTRIERETDPPHSFFDPGVV